MASPDVRLIAAARRAYEAGRLLSALPAAALAAPLTAASWLACDSPAASLACGAALAISLLAFGWAGRGLRRGARAGLLAGLPGLVLPLATRCWDHPCSPGSCDLLSSLCVAGGVAGGLLLGWLASRRRSDLGGFLLGSISSALLSGSLGCLILGAAGMSGLAAGLALAGPPVFLLARRRT